MTLDLKREEILGLVDQDKGLIDRKLFSDQEIYDLEMENIFARAWQFMAHESQIEHPGDFFMTYMGEDRVIVVRDKSGQPRVLLNTCRHRGNAVCRAEEGHATSFMCTYHGWTYDLQGKLVGVPGFKDYYHEDLNREEWGLITAAKVDSYKGFIFATLDPEAIPLDEFLGDVGRMSINVIAAKAEDLVVVGGIQKYIIGCNWKFAVDNVWDYYHGGLTHASVFMARMPTRANRQNPAAGRGSPAAMANRNHHAVLGEYGHAIGGPEFDEERQKESGQPPEAWREWPEARRELGPVGLKVAGHPHIFPNFWVCGHNGLGQVSIRMPKGPNATEIWWFTFLDRAHPDDHSEHLNVAVHTFGPAGMLEQEDGENWDQSTRGAHGTVAKRFPLHYGMNLGRGEIIEDELGPPRIEITGMHEHAQLWHYRNWAQWLAADGWGDLKANHPVPSGKV